MDLHLTGRRALVTGAASGIGAAVARALADEGVHVTALDRSDAVRSLGFDALVADVTDESAMSAIGSLPLDFVVTCAGVSGPMGTPLSGVTADDWRRVFDVNVTGTFLTLKYALPSLRRSPVGAAVAIASDSAVVAAPGMVPYCASKGAVVQLVRALAVEEPSVRVNALCPSVVDTPMSRSDLGDAAFDGSFPVHTADEIAAQAVLLCSPVTRGVNAVSLLSDFGYAARSSFPA